MPTPTNAAPPSVMPWTGERMVPNHSDLATELFHWQRYLFFRPWYDEAKVVDAASGEGYGANYASVFASQVKGIDISDEAVAHANIRYPHADFVQGDVCAADYSDADLVVSFETIEHLPAPETFLEALKSCKGRIVISTPNRKTHSPGNKLDDKPLNQFHTIEWTPAEFAQLIRKHFPERQVRFLSQEGRWPGLITEGLDDEAMYCIAVIGDGELPKWPKLGIAIPTLDNGPSVEDTVISMTRFYPGEIQFAIVSNGGNAQTIAHLKRLQSNLPHIVHLIEEPINHGYGVGTNIGLDFLAHWGGFDYLGVSNDDVMPATACMVELVSAFEQLKSMGNNPGAAGPVSNSVNGPQLVDIGAYKNYQEMLYAAEPYHRSKANSGTNTVQLRGLLMLIDPQCLAQIGGFDPIFGIGNFEDDDHNIRARLAGYSLWIVDGAFLHHEGSATFRRLGVNYESTIEKNAHILMDKWGLTDTAQIPGIAAVPEGVELFVPLSARSPQSVGQHSVIVDGRSVDLLNQATDIEFAAWLVQQMQGRDKSLRSSIIGLLDAA